MPPYFDFIDGANLQQPTYLETGSTHTITAAPGYSAPNAPPARQTPSHIVYDPQLLQKMNGCLRSYLGAKRGPRPVSNVLATTLDITRRRLVATSPNLTNEAATVGFFWMNIAPLVIDFVHDVDGVAPNLEEAPPTYGAKSDSGGIWGGRVHVEFKSPRALLHHVGEIFELGRANNGRGSALVLRPQEGDGRFIIFKIGISMATRDLTWGILTSGLVSIFFYRHVAPDINGDPHHILSCSELVYIDATGPSLFSLCAATLLGAEDPHALDPKPVIVRITLQPYPFPSTANTGRHRGSCNYPKSTQNPRGSTSRDVSPPQMSHARQPLHPPKLSRTLPGLRKAATLVYRVGTRRPCLWKYPTLRVQFVVSYWPDLVYNLRRVRSGTSRFSGHTGRGTKCRIPPPHLKLYERVGRGKFGQVHDGTLSMPQSRAKHNVVAKLFLCAHLDKLHNEIRLYRTCLVRLRNKAIPNVFGAFVIRGFRATAETMEKWGLIVMEKCGSAVQSVDELTVDQREAAYRCLYLIHQAGVEHGDFHLNNILFSSGGVRVIDFSEAVEHDCSGPDCYELRRAREYLELPPN